MELLHALKNQLSFQDLLREELNRRCEINSRYSLRAFAAEMGLSPSRMSEILKGKQGLSRERAKDLCERLQFDTAKTQLFCDLVDSMHARSEDQRTLAKTRLLEYEVDTDVVQITQDTFAIISNWYHLAILSLLECPRYEHTPRALAAALGITEIQVREALERLLRVEVITKNKAGYKVEAPYLATTDGVPAEANRIFHRQMLAKAAQAIELQSIQRRSVSSSLLTVRRSEVPKAFATLKRFRRRFIKEFGETPLPDTVYCLSMQFFDLTLEAQNSGL